MRTKQKWALTLLLASGAMSCGDSQTVDPYQSFIDGSRLDTRFKPRTGCGARTSTGALNSASCYQEGTAWFNGEARPFYNLALYPKSTTLTDATLPTSVATTTSYDFLEGCKPGKPFDVRTDAYTQDAQFSVFDALPLASTATNAPVLYPLVRVKNWMGASQYTCNAIKSDTSLTGSSYGGVHFDGSPSEGDMFAVREIIDPTYLPVTPSATAPQVVAPFGWYRGLLLSYFDGGAVSVRADGNFKTMDGVWVKPTTAGAAATDPDAKLIFQARPGEADWSPVVRLREVAAAPANANAINLCYSATATPPTPCPADSIDLSKVTTFTGVLFVAPKPQ